MGQKRRLTDQQRHRIAAKQAKARGRAGLTNTEIETADLGPEQRGLFIAHFGQQAEIQALEDDHQGERFRCHFRADVTDLVTGDEVIWRKGSPTGVIVAKQPRKSELLRPDNRGQLRPVAANIDLIVVVFAAAPTPFQNLIDRYLVAAELQNIEVLMVLNKADMTEHQSFDEAKSLLSLYQQSGFQCIEVSSKSSQAIAALHDRLAATTSVLVGQSGVGKSSIINALMPEADALTGELSALKDKGTHTTTTSRLFHFQQGGKIIDSPGIREFGLWHIEHQQVIDGFRDLKPFAGDCQFRDCRHLAEPKCGVKAALARGDIVKSRFDSYHNIVNSLQ